MTQEWGLSKSVLGVVLSIELAGMAGGAIFLGSFADSHGRRFTMLSGITVVTLGMLVAGLAPNIYVLGAARFCNRNRGRGRYGRSRSNLFRFL